jgi:hypothetical protein
MQFLAIFTILTVFMLGFILSIKFSRYRQRPEQSGCCGGGHCEIGIDGKLSRSKELTNHVCCKKYERT